MYLETHFISLLKIPFLAYRIGNQHRHCINTSRWTCLITKYNELASTVDLYLESDCIKVIKDLGQITNARDRSHPKSQALRFLCFRGEWFQKKRASAFCNIIKWKSLPRPHGVHIKMIPEAGMIHHMKTHHLHQRKNQPFGSTPKKSPFLEGGKGTDGTRVRSRLAMVSSDESQFGGAERMPCFVSVVFLVVRILEVIWTS